MKLSSLDIRKQEFSRAFRGYDKEEVHAFLQMLSNQWQELVDEKARLEEKMREQEMKLQHYMKVEEALEQALQTARESSRQAIENAERKARMMIEEAEARAEGIKREAEEERHQIKREAAKITGRRHEIVARLRAFLMSEMELLAHYEGDDPIGFIKLLPGENREARGGRMLSESAPSTEETSEAGEAYEEDVVLKELADEIASLEPTFAGEEDAGDAAGEAGTDGEEETLAEGTVEAETQPPFEGLHEPAGEEAEVPESEAVEASEASREEPSYERPAWVVRPLVSPEGGSGGEGGETPHAEGKHIPADEIAKIRRILDDLE
jgi:cell division initiation protein